MELSQILISVIIVVLGSKFFIWYRRRLRFINAVDKLPGPPSWPVFGTLFYDLLVPRDEQYKHVMARTRKFGPIYRSWWGPKAIVHLTRPEHVEVIMTNSKNITKSFDYVFIIPWLGTGLLISTGKKWFAHRKMITPTFHFDILEKFMDTFCGKSDILTEKLASLTEGRAQGFDIFPFIAKCALDIICETAMGTAVNAQDEVESEYVRAIYDISNIIVERAIRPWFWPQATFNLCRDGQRHKACLATLHGFTRRVIEERKRSRREKEEVECGGEDWGKKKRVAFLDLLLEASESSATPLTDEEIREEVDTFMFEGHDTTSAGIAWTVFLLGSYPNHQDAVYQELEDIFADDPGRKITTRDCASMKYLERVIKESLRLFPSVPFIGRELSEDVHIAHYCIPAGSTCSLEITNVHRNPDQFPEPEKFNPDHFLPENVKKRHSFSYVPFSAGPRNCIGQKFALLEEKCILASILRKFKVTSLEKLEDLTLMNELILRPKSGIKVRLDPRL